MQSVVCFLSAGFLLVAAARLKHRCARIEAPLAGEAPMWVFVTRRWAQGSTPRSRRLRMLTHLARLSGWAMALQAWRVACDVL